MKFSEKNVLSHQIQWLEKQKLTGLGKQKLIRSKKKEQLHCYIHLVIDSRLILGTWLR